MKGGELVVTISHARARDRMEPSAQAIDVAIHHSVDQGHGVLAFGDVSESKHECRANSRSGAALRFTVMGCSGGKSPAEPDP